MKQRAYVALTLIMTSLLSIWAEGHHFIYDDGKYADETVIFMALQDADSNRVDYPGSFLGAFINGECRYEASAETDATSGHIYYMLRVKGDSKKETGAAITFRLFIMSATGGAGKEYLLDGINATFNGDYRDTEVSSPMPITFVPTIGVEMNPITVHRGSTVNLLDYITKIPANGSLPLLTWVSMEEPGDAPCITIDGNNLTANVLTSADGVKVRATAGGESIVETTVFVDAPAKTYKWDNAYSNGRITVNVNDYEKLTQALQTGLIFTPADATTKFTWTSDNTDVVTYMDTNDSWMPLRAGTAELTGTPNDDSGLHPTLTVTVIQPVTSLNRKNVFLIAEEGEDITDRLNALVSPYPSSANDKRLSWGFPEGQVQQSVTLTDGHFIASAVTGQVVKVVATTMDGSNISDTIYVGVLPVQAKSIAAVQNPLYLTLPAGGGTMDFTQELMGNINIMPCQGTTDYLPLIYSLGAELRAVVESAIENHPSREEIAQALYYFDKLKNYIPVILSFDFEGAEGIVNVEPQKDGSSIYTLTGKGSFTAKANVRSILFAKFDDPKTLITQMTALGEAGLYLLVNTLTASFTVTTKDGLGSFLVSDVKMVKDTPYKLTLTEQPVGSEFDKDKISVRIVPDVNDYPNDWVYATATRDVNDASGKVYIINAKSIGQGKIYVDYDKQPDFGVGNINVEQQLTVNSGWQWIALQQGDINGFVNMRTAFGDQLAEIRSQGLLTINDSQYGYFGKLTVLEADSTYKLCMKEGTIDQTFTVENKNQYLLGVNTPINKELRKGWNWIGNPYQYYQLVNEIFGTTNFSEGDMLKSKESFATYTAANGWVGTLRYVTPGQGLLLYKQEAGTTMMTAEGSMNQNETMSATARVRGDYEPCPWRIYSSEYEDNMAMVAQVNGVDDPCRTTLWAFVGDECRGRGEVIGDCQFITVHGNPGEKVTFRLYDQLTGRFHSVYGHCVLSSMQGTVKSPVPLHVGSVITDINSLYQEDDVKDDQLYDLQGRRVGSVLAKGIYVKNGKKVIIK